MRPTGPQPAETTERRREPEGGRGYARRIDCGQDNYTAASPGHAREGGMRDPSTTEHARQHDPGR